VPSATAISNDTHAVVGSGNVTLTDTHGRVDVTSGSGNLVVRGAKDEVRARAGSGDIDIEQPAGNVVAEAGSGDIHGKGVPKNMWSIRTGSGNVTLNVPSEAAFDVDISSSSGSVTLGHPVNTTVQGRIQESKKSVVGKVRGGGPIVSVHTGSGDVQVD